MKKKTKYKRVLLKLSGEVFKGDKDSGIDDKTVLALCKEIVAVKKLGVEIAIVIGAGNMWRYRDHISAGFDRVHSDNMGMVATIVNSMYLQGVFEKLSVDARVCSAIEAPKVVGSYTSRTGREHLNKGRIVICAGGTGSPFFTTDSAAALRALELQCDAFLKATKVDYVYDKDPMKYKNAKKFKKLSYSDVLAKDLNVIDMTAVSLCREGNVPILVFNLTKKGNIAKVVKGENVGTLIN
ncbi:MAG: UMP kinase [Patescibacteria group bacterium]|nr:UMP kinase [Patescibacteria group bacterium]